MKIRIGSDDDLPLQETINMHDVVIFINSIFNENHNHYNYHAFLEKFSYK